ncbi:MAG TPA: hypothetical protein VGM62_06390 [Chthoniobacterales bacterium]
MAQLAVAPFSWATQSDVAGPVAAHFHLATVESFVTKNADPLIVKRGPLAKFIGRAQKAQAFIQWQVGPGCHVTTLPG